MSLLFLHNITMISSYRRWQKSRIRNYSYLYPTYLYPVKAMNFS
ncbi:hypothetical protein B4168_0232 [Anoxybacillus flavithermus]|nr:hypothetical protein B4168_0232 [Anoxybacillus flavithermus]